MIVCTYNMHACKQHVSSSVSHFFTVSTVSVYLKPGRTCWKHCLSKCTCTYMYMYFSSVYMYMYSSTCMYKYSPAMTDQRLCTIIDYHPVRYFCMPGFVYCMIWLCVMYVVSLIAVTTLFIRFLNKIVNQPTVVHYIFEYHLSLTNDEPLVHWLW